MFSKATIKLLHFNPLGTLLDITNCLGHGAHSECVQTLCRIWVLTEIRKPCQSHPEDLPCSVDLLLLQWIGWAKISQSALKSVVRPQPLG
jgi:hypothetical protein